MKRDDRVVIFSLPGNKGVTPFVFYQKSNVMFILFKYYTNKRKSNVLSDAFPLVGVVEMEWKTQGTSNILCHVHNKIVNQCSCFLFVGYTVFNFNSSSACCFDFFVWKMIDSSGFSDIYQYVH